MPTIDRELDRIGGEAKLVIVHDDERVVDAYFLTLAPVRGFEKLVLGKNPIFVVEAVMRICGICHAAHAIAAAEAFEDALGIMPPANGRILREAIGLINRVQSHLFHLVLLLPDILVENEVRTYVVETIKLLNLVNEIMMRIGGAPTHPPNVAIGGIAKPIPEASLREAIRRVDEVRKLFEDLREKIFSSDRVSPKVELLRKHSAFRDGGFIASHLFYGDKHNIDVEKVSVVRYEEFRKNVEMGSGSRTTSMVALYDGKIVEAGPRARLRTYKEFADGSLLGLQLARLNEIELALHRIKELLQQVELSAPVRTGTIVFRRGRGVGVYEAPRGTLIHFVELDDEGRVRSYRIVVPTMFNIPVIERCLVGLPIEIVDVVPRLYDPCIPCSTHFVRVRR